MAMTVPFRLPPTTIDYFGYIIQGVLTFFMLIMYIPPLYRTVYRIVAEKESRAKESMKMMGLGDFAYWASWFFYYTCVNFLIAVGCWAVLSPLVLIHSDGLILFLIIFLYGQSIFGLLVATQSIFGTARMAAVVTTVVYFGSAMIEELSEDPKVSKLRLILCCLSPTVAMIRTVYCLGAFEASNVGTHWFNIDSDHGGFSVLFGMKMMVVNIFFWLTVGVYMELVMPKTFGKPLHPLFCLLPRTYRCKSKK
jgi:ATP-binding cassette, subfamily A (ABC1), member 3